MKNKICITTQIGDRGATRLFSGEEVSKNSLRIEAQGDLDELGCVLGIARLHTRKKSVQKDILALQRDLFIIGSELATTALQSSQLPRRVDEDFLSVFEKKRDALHAVTRIPSGFVIAGASVSSAWLDLARAVSRRMERRVVTLFERKEMDNRFLLIWVNRISDYLYLLARFEEGKPILVKK